MSLSHHHDHESGGHRHFHGAVSFASGNEQRVFWVMLLTGGFMVIEIVGGLLSGSLALLADSGHMASDAASLMLAWLAFRVARRPATHDKSYGWHRTEVLAAFVNGVMLFVVAGWIMVEAAQRLFSPQPVLGVPMLGVAVAGMLVNVLGVLILHRGDRNNVNIRGALLHVVGDLLGSVAAILAALIVLTTGWTPADPILSVLVTLLILKSAWRLVKISGHILLEGAPERFDHAALFDAVKRKNPGIVDLHHLHVWSLTVERRLATVHVVVASGTDRDQALEDVRQILGEVFGVSHATIQIEGQIEGQSGNSLGCEDGSACHGSILRDRDPFHTGLTPVT